MSTTMRLRGELRGRPLRFTVPTDGCCVGSDPTCHVSINDPTISRRHAELKPVDAGLEIHDLGSTNGTWLDGRRVDTLVVPPGSVIAFGRVELTLEGVAAADRQIAVGLPDTVLGIAPKPKIVDPTLGASTTLGLSPVDALSTEGLPHLVERLHDGASRLELVEEAGAMLVDSLPVGAVEIRRSGGGILFQGEGKAEIEQGFPVEIEVGDVVVRVVFGHRGPAAYFSPVVDTVARLIDLAGGWRRRGAPAAGPRAPHQPPQPPLPHSADPAVQEIYRRAARVAAGQIGVLVLGESGTGKEVLARYLHEASGRAAFVALNCAALPRDLLEAELFGIEKGTATGVEPRPGKLESAHDGTLFLDEIGDMALETQAKILRVLQEGEVYRLGGSSPRPARARVVAATNRDVEMMVESGTFRLDLYHRIAGWVVELPPLRRRLGDIPNLAAHFLGEEASRLGVGLQGISQAALDALLAYHWPGNIRQLQQEIARCALFMDDGEVLETTHLADAVRRGANPSIPVEDLATRVERFERLEIERALAAEGGNVAATAARLGIHRATLYRRMKALGLSGTDEIETTAD